MGISGYHDKIEYKIGSSRLTKIDNSNYDIFLTADKKLIASISVQDELKSDVIDIVNDLKKTGIRCSLLSGCLLYTSPSPRDRQKSRMPSSA